MSAMSESCPMCGTPTHEESRVETINELQSVDVVEIAGLKEELEKNLILQQENPNHKITTVLFTSTEEEDFEGCDRLMETDVPLEFSSFCHFYGTAEEVIPNSMSDGKPHLIYYIELDEDGEVYRRFQSWKKSEAFYQFEHTDFYGKQTIVVAIDFEDNASEAALTLTEILQLVYQLPPLKFEFDTTISTDTKDAECKQHAKAVKEQGKFKLRHLPYLVKAIVKNLK